MAGEKILYDQEIFDLLESYGTDDYGNVKFGPEHAQAMIIYDRWADFLTAYPADFESTKKLYIQAAKEFIEEWPLFKEILQISDVLDVEEGSDDEFRWTFQEL
jgi:hypothetical protein